MRILWLKTELLHPVDKGGRIRTYQMLREIAREHDVHYLTLDDGAAAPDAVARASEYSKSLERIPFHPPAKGSVAFFGALAGNVLDGLPYAVGRYRSAAMLAAVRVAASRADLVVCDFLAPAVNVPTALPVPSVLFQHNVESMIWERHATVATSLVRRQYMREQWRRMERFERATCHRFDHVVAVSPQDADEMRSRFSVDHVSAIPTGVDVEYFTPSGHDQPRPNEVVFTGSMDWMPNDDAMRWFLESMWPRVRQQIPDASLTIVGRAPSDRLSAMAMAAGGVEVSGRVPDVRPYLERASAFVVPMRVGGGTRLKIYEAMAMALPVISTAIGAEGLPVHDGDTVVLRETPEAFADAVVAALRERARDSIGVRAQTLVRREFGWPGVARAFMDTCEAVRSGTAVAAATHRS